MLLITNKKTYIYHNFVTLIKLPCLSLLEKEMYTEKIIFYEKIDRNKKLL